MWNLRNPGKQSCAWLIHASHLKCALSWQRTNMEKWLCNIMYFHLWFKNFFFFLKDNCMQIWRGGLSIKKLFWSSHNSFLLCIGYVPGTWLWTGVCWVSCWQWGFWFNLSHCRFCSDCLAQSDSRKDTWDPDLSSSLSVFIYVWRILIKIRVKQKDLAIK